MAVLKKILTIILPKKKANEKGASATATYSPSGSGVLSAPAYLDHMTDIFTSRSTYDSRSLMKEMFKHDPDVSATVSAYLTIAATEPIMLVYDAEGNLSKDGVKLLEQLLVALTTRVDYSLGFQLKPTLRALCEEFRYMTLLRGAIGAELVLNKMYLPTEVRLIDPSSVKWTEKAPGQYKPSQEVQGQNAPTNLDLPTVFWSFFRRDPTEIYTYSTFVAAINTIAARQQVINDLYRIMNITGFPRMELEVMEDVLVKNAPANVRDNAASLRTWMEERLKEIGQAFSSIRADQAYVHTDAVQPKIMNSEKPGATLDISKVIETLNAQNQAALKTVSTVIGRGESGVNTASVEARVFSLNADALNDPIEEILSGILTLAIRLNGFDGRVEVSFRPAELRPETELEPQLSLRQTRLLTDLSLGLITDEYYHLKMYGRLPPDGTVALSGTGFQHQNTGASQISPNSDPMGKSLSPDGSKAAQSNGNKKPTTKK